MKTFKGKLSLLLIAFFLVACASQSEYREADSRGYGYTERQLSDDHYRIHFKARGDDTGAAMDYAMLRASEVTMEREHDWFRVVNRETLVDRENRSSGARTGAGARYETVQDCGLLTCRSYQRPVQHYETGMRLGDGNREVEVILEIRTGTGIRPEADQSFDAREVYENLRPEQNE